MAARGSFFNSSDSWLTDYESCNAVGRKAMEAIGERNQQQKNSVSYSLSNVQARQLIKKFSEARDELVGNLAARQDSLLEGEFERRQRLLDQLWSKKLQLEAAFNERVDTSSRDELLGHHSRAFPNSSSWATEETDDTRDLSIEDLKQQQQLVLKEQDRGLDSLHEVVVRQKLMAQNIGKELELHNEIIEDITDHADRTRERLLKETRHVTIVDRKSNTCGYWVVIVLLLAVIVIIACVPSPKK